MTVLIEPTMLFMDDVIFYHECMKVFFSSVRNNIATGPTLYKWRYFTSFSTNKHVKKLYIGLGFVLCCLGVFQYK